VPRQPGAAGQTACEWPPPARQVANAARVSPSATAPRWNAQGADQHLNMVLGDVEETVTTTEVDEETCEEIVHVRFMAQAVWGGVPRLPLTPPSAHPAFSPCRLPRFHRQQSEASRCYLCAVTSSFWLASNDKAQCNNPVVALIDMARRPLHLGHGAALRQRADARQEPGAPGGAARATGLLSANGRPRYSITMAAPTL
jgi:hypothetical protein